MILIAVASCSMVVCFRTKQGAADKGNAASIADIQTVRLLSDGASNEVVAREPPRQRLNYLDNLKSALTVDVVIFHVAGAFAGGGSVGLSVGNYRNWLQPFLSAMQLLNQVQSRFASIVMLAHR